MANTMHYAFSTMVKLSGGFAPFESVNGSFPPLQTELCYTNTFQHSPPPVPCELVTDQPGFRQSLKYWEPIQAKASVLQAGIMESRCLPYPAGLTLAGVNTLRLHAINH
jgi:hypothetical protein